MRIGVLGLQGAVREHVRSLDRLGIESRTVKRTDQLDGLDGLILPGGESTAISLLADGPFLARLREMAHAEFPMFGTCAGMILLAARVEGRESPYIGAIDIDVERNASGRQVHSFETELEIEGIGPYGAVFIRAPYIVRQGPGVTVLARYDDTATMAREKNILVCSFHPELTDDARIHRVFADMIDTGNQRKEDVG